MGVVCRSPVLGARQRFPQRCGGCGDLFARGDPIAMLPVLHEGEVLCIGRWPALSGDVARPNRGRPLWVLWLCSLCAHLTADAEPPEARQQRVLAEHALGTSAVAAGRQRAIARARAQLRVR